MAISKQLNRWTANKFRIVCTEMPFVSALANDVVLTAVTLNPAEIPTRFSDLKRPGEKIDFDVLSITFLLDENWDSYIEIWSWMNKMCGTDDTNEIIEERELVFPDIDVIILTNAGTQIRKIRHKNCWPTSLTPPPITTSDAEYATCEASFHFDAMEFIPDTKNLTKIDKAYYNH